MKGRTPLRLTLLAVLCVLASAAYQLLQHYDVSLEALPGRVSLLAAGHWSALHSILSPPPVDPAPETQHLDPMRWLDEELYTPEREPVPKDVAIVASPSATADTTELMLALMAGMPGRTSELDIDTTDSLLSREFEAWSRAISSKLQNWSQSLHSEEQQFLQQVTGEHNVSQTQAHRAPLVHIEELLIDLAADVAHIDCSSEINRATNEIIYYDAHRNEIPHYITRPYLRKQLEKVNNHLKQFRSDALGDLRELHERFLGDLAAHRRSFVETYEEWGDVMVTEWSARIAHADVSAPDFQMDRWGHFVRLKGAVLQLRDTLREQETDTQPLEEYLEAAARSVNGTVDAYNQRIAQLLREASANFALRDSREVEEADSLQHLISRELQEGTAKAL